MPALLDDREDPDMRTLLERWGIPVSVVRLDSADFVLQSSGGLNVAFERKRLSDMVNCMQERRLTGLQLRNMRSTYDRTEIVFEGMMRPDQNGSLCVPRNGSWVPYYFGGNGISYRQLDSFLYTQYECAGVPCWRTMSIYETAQLYVSRYHWWQKDYDLHRSHDCIYSNDPTKQRRGAVTIHEGEPNPVTLVAAQIPGIDAKAWDIGKAFRSISDMVNASDSEWRRVPWTDRKGNVKHFGKQTVKEIRAWLTGNAATT
jgi:ERCC4-type nuclease